MDPADYVNGIFGVTFPGPPPVQKTLYAERQGLQIYHSWVYEGFESQAGIDAARSDIRNAISMVRSYAADIGNSSVIFAVRDDFNGSLAGTFLAGADGLTLADLRSPPT